ncbi:MAG: GH92 family glycosyl hydrolase [Pyrinomonadaceae bacterium]
MTAELTSTKRVGLHRYTFPRSNNSQILLDLFWRDKVLASEARIVGKNKIEGFRRSSSWAENQVVFFVIEFSKPFKKSIFSNGHIIEQNGSTGNGLRAYFEFETGKNEQILVRVAISPVSIEGARKNLKAELDHWDFEKVKEDARSDWNKELSKIEVSGGTDAQMTTLYTALYHTMIAPNIFQDVDGKYLGLDKKIHSVFSPGSGVQSPKSKNQSPSSDNYTIFSLWDTFRATHPLYTIIDEKRTADFINTFIRHYEQGGKLPVWELAANETDTMIGYHSVSVIADAMAKGIKGFDYVKAFEAAKHSAELDFRGLDSYRKRGYISMEDEQESVSKTLEYAYNDYCIAVMAKILSETDEITWGRSVIDINEKKKAIPLDKWYRDQYQLHLKRSQFYKNLFDKQSGFMRPKQNGNWISPFAPNEVTFHFTEGNSWVYSFFVPHDVSGLISLYGGKDNFTKKLDELFSTEDKLVGREQPDITGLIGQYAHGNEPSHHIAYLYNYAGQPWKTQALVRRIMDEFYKPQPDGLIGNEDCGQMSAWYILSALGFYQVNPSVPVYAIGSPLFREAKIHLENGKTFIIKGENSGSDISRAAAENPSLLRPFITSVSLDGRPYRKSFFSHSDLQNGGTLEFEMSAVPVKDWYTESPVSKVEIDFPPVPTIEGKRVFEEKTDVVISTPEKDVSIFYTLDGKNPDEKSKRYSSPIPLNETSLIKAISVNSSGTKSLVAESKINKMPNDWDVELFSTYNRQYTGGGAKGLIDGIRGTTNFASGEWQGYQDQDFVAVVDLKRETTINKLGAGFLQVARSWIWMPVKIEFETSTDGRNFTKAAEILTNFPEREMTHTIRDYVKEIPAKKARFVRIKAANLGTIPDWHPGAGFKAFIFVDEIIIGQQK